MLYIGHAGVLIRYGDVVIAIDPFLSGRFFWNGKENVYKGNSPWIGPEQMHGFIEKYANQITAVAFTHAHMDHFDPAAIFSLLKENPDIQILAPYPITDWIKASSIIDPMLARFLIPVEWLGEYEIEADTDCINVAIMPNSGIKEEFFPYRVGYLVFAEEGRGVFHPGDSHDTGPWEKYKEKVTDLVLWNTGHRYEIVDYFRGNDRLKNVWWIHWEEFTPGNFTCSENPREYIETCKKSGIESGLLDYTTWKVLE